MSRRGKQTMIWRVGKSSHTFLCSAQWNRWNKGRGSVQSLSIILMPFVNTVWNVWREASSQVFFFFYFQVHSASADQNKTRRASVSLRPCCSQQFSINWQLLETSATKNQPQHQQQWLKRKYFRLLVLGQWIWILMFCGVVLMYERTPRVWGYNCQRQNHIMDWDPNQLTRSRGCYKDSKWTRTRAAY